MAAKEPKCIDKISLISAAVKISFYLMLFFTVVFTIFHVVFPSLILNVISVEEAESIRIYSNSFLVLGLSAILSAFFSFSNGAFSGLNKLHIDNLFSAPLAVLNLISILIAIQFEMTLVEFSITLSLLVFMLNLSKVLLLFKIIKRYEKDLIESFSQPSERSKEILIVGLNMVLFSLSVILISNIDNIIIAKYMTSSSVSVYSLSFKIFNLLYGFIMLINLSLAPLIGNELSNNNYNWITNKYRVSVQVSLFLAVMIWIASCFFGPQIIGLWLGNTAYVGDSVFFLMGLFGCLYCLTNANVVVMTSMGLTKYLPFVGFAEIFINVLISLLLIEHYGLIGVIWGSIVASALIPNIIIPIIITTYTNGKVSAPYVLLFKMVLLVIPVMYVSYYFLTEPINLMEKFIILFVICLFYTVANYKILSCKDKIALKLKVKSILV
ncbi:oligosaccharide flippase family protein [Vibrio aestuarianus subsp. cardii]|nr:oligosaccharide flippase family protein [Vibrio aestuarianus subsp. cardii]